MTQFYQRKTFFHFLRSNLGILILIIICILVARAVYARYVVEREMYHRQVEIGAKAEQLRERKDRLQERVEYLSSDRGIEAEMRRNFDVTKPGEEVVIILDEEEGRKIEPLPEVEPAKPWWRFWE